MPDSKTILDHLKKELRKPGDLAVFRAQLKKYGRKLRVNRLHVDNGYLNYTGTVGPWTFYKMRGSWMGRAKSTLDKKRVNTDEAFAGSRKSAARFAAGNQLASRLYARVEQASRKYSLFCFLKKRAILLLKEGHTQELAENILLDYLRAFGVVAAKKKRVDSKNRKRKLSRPKYNSDYPPGTIDQLSFLYIYAEPVMAYNTS